MDYEKLLIKAKEAYNKCATNAEKRRLETIFPELKESEDERIRKTLIDFVEQYGDNYYGQVAKASAISWLEKQGTPAKLSEEEQNRFTKGILSSCALSFINYLDAHKYEGKMCVSNGECEDIENAFHNAMWDRLHRYYCKYIEKQGEQKSVEWSEEDEVMLQTTIDTLEDFSKGKLPLSDSGYDIAITEIQWLKSLKPQPHWKPTEEQMNELEKLIVWADELYDENSIRTIESLYNDIKKL